MLRKRQTPRAGWDTQEAGLWPASLLALTAPRSNALALHHSAHVAHAAHAATHAGSGLFGWLGDDRLGHEDVLRDRGGVLQRRTRDHRRVDDARLDQVFDLVRVDVQALALGGSTYLVQDDRAIETGVVSALEERLLASANGELGDGVLIR